MKTISMYLRASKTEAEEAGIETDGMADSVSKLRNEILKLSKVDIMADSKTYKSTYQILKELAGVWDELSDVTQANILEKLGGKRNANVVASIIENFDVAEKALLTSMDSLGSATTENEKYLESIEGRLNKLKVAFEELSESVISSDLVKGSVKFLTDITNGLNDIVKIFGAWSIPVAFGASALFNSNKMGLSTAVEDGKRLFTVLGRTKEEWKALNNSIKQDGGSVFKTFRVAFSDQFKSLFGFKTNKDVDRADKQLSEYLGGLVAHATNADGTFNNAADSLNAYLQLQLKGNNILADATDETAAAALAITQKVQATNSATDATIAGGAAIDKYIIAQRAQVTATTAGTVAIQGLKAAFAALAPMLIVASISSIIESIKAEAEARRQEKEEAVSAAKDEVKAATDTYESLNKLKKTYGESEDQKNKYIEKTEELASKLKDEGVELDDLIAKYHDLDKAIAASSFNKIKDSLPGLQDGVGLSSNSFAESLNKSSFAITQRLTDPLTYGSWQAALSKANISFDVDISSTELIEAVRQWEIEQGLLQKGAREASLPVLNSILDTFAKANYDRVLNTLGLGGISGGEYVAAGREYYEQLISLRSKLFEERLTETDLYKQVDTEINKLSGSYTELMSDIELYNKNLVTSLLLEKELKDQIPETYEDYLKYRKELAKDIYNDKNRQGNKDDIDKAIQSVLELDSYTSSFEKRFQHIVSLTTRINTSKDISNKQELLDYISQVGEQELDIILKLDDSELETDIGNVKNKVKRELAKQALSTAEVDGAIDISETADKISKLQSALKDVYDGLEGTTQRLPLTLEQSQKLMDTYGADLKEFYDTDLKRLVMSAQDIESFFESKKVEEMGDLFDKVTAVNEAMVALDEARSAGAITDKEYNTEKKQYETWLSTLKVQAAYIDSYTLAKQKLDEYNNSLDYYAKLNEHLSTLNIARELMRTQATADPNEWYSNFETQAKAMVEAFPKLRDQFEKWYNNAIPENAQALVDAYNKAYNEDLDNFNQWLKIKATSFGNYDDSQSVWHDFIISNEEAVDHLNELYKTDLRNFTTWSEARKVIIAKAAGISDISKIPTSALAAALSAHSDSAPDDIESALLSWLTGSDKTDPHDTEDSTTKSLRDADYAKKLKKIQDINTGTLEAERQFVNSWIALNDEIYKTTDPEKYKSNLEEIAQYIVGLDSVVQKHLEQWGRDFGYNENDYASRMVYLEEWKQSSKSVWTEPFEAITARLRAVQAAGEDATDTLKSLKEIVDAINSDTRAQAEFSAETLKQRFGGGWYTNFDEYKNDILNLAQEYRGINGENLLDDSFFNNYISATSEYEAFLKEANKANDKTIESEMKLRDDIREKLLELKNDNRFKMSPNEFLEHYTSDYADPLVEFINDQLDKGIIDPELAKKKIQEIYDTALDVDGIDLGKGWLSDALDIDSYEYDLKELQKNNDKSVESERRFIQEWRQANEQYNDPDSKFYNPAQYEANLKEITDYELAYLKQALDEGKIELQDYVNFTAEALSQADILGAEYIYEAAKDVADTRAQREKTYWEQQKYLATKYYDTEIEKLQKIQDEHDRIAEAEKLQLNLVKARIELEKAKSQRNQLVFYNGTFEYMADQEAIMSAEKDVSEALDAIKDNELKEQIRILQESKDYAVAFYDDIIEVIDAFINKTVWIAESDSETLKMIDESEYGQQMKAVQAGEVAPNSLTEDQKSVTGTAKYKKEKADKAIDKAHENQQADPEKLSKEWSDYINKPIVDVLKEIKELIKIAGQDSAYVLGVSNSAQEITKAGIQNIVSNGSISNDNSVSTGDIHMTIQGGTSQEMLEQFASKLSSAIKTATPRALAY